MAQDQDIEVWESTTGSTAWVYVKDPRAKTGWRPKQVGGVGSKKITLTREEREYNQEQVLDENAHLDPFGNGHLICISGRPITDKSRYELTDDELMQTLSITDDAIFADAVDDIDSELLLRRLLGLAQEHAPNARYEQLKTIVDSRYQTGGTQRSVQEMIDAGEKIGATLSG